MLKKILDKKNIEGAYFDLITKFDELGKSNRYTGVDGLSLNDFDINSAKTLQIIKKEMINLSPLSPALEFIIPKKNKGERKIYIYTVKDRIKAQAVHRIVEPFFENLYSDFLFSYRSSHPSYYVAKTIVKRYKKYFGKDYIFYFDISNYTENIDKEILRKKLSVAGLSEDVMKLLDLFIDNPIISDGKVKYWNKGVVQGVPIIALFANIYLNDIDKYVGKKVSLYRRVGDDLILFDKDKEKIKSLRKYILEETFKLGLKIKKEKTMLIKSSEEFNFLGYNFSNKKIKIGQSSVNKAMLNWKNKLKYYPVSNEKKNKRLVDILYKDLDSIHNQFVVFISSYKQSNDKKQIKKISENFFHILTKYFFKKYSKRNERLMRKLIKVKIPSLYNYYLQFHNGQKTIKELSLSKKKFN